ncbi:MAG: T9SS type A sorting domain-containing protein [Sphingobacteriales bacterium]|nr:T9SS type A sorting domain-containing protein [Sphingobacteriales bacterium]
MRKSILLLTSLMVAVCTFAQYSIGNRKFILIDKSRSNRSILTFVYYPAISTGLDAPIVNDGSKFPVVSFGHGFVMSSLAYQWLAEALVPYGYIVAFPGTEEGVPPNHSDFGKDEVFVARAFRNYGDSATSFLFGKTNGYTAVGGHSMGGGASFLGMQNVTDITTFFNFSAAETFITESAIQSAKNCNRPALVFTGTKDCVAPPIGNSRFMYNNLASEYKFFANIVGGSHCQFGDPNKTPCELGETLVCAGTTYISQADQKNKVLLLLKPWLDFWTKRECAAITTYYNNVAGNLSAIDTLQSKIITCGALDVTTAVRNQTFIRANLFPNPTTGNFTLETAENYTKGYLQLTDVAGKVVDAQQFNSQRSILLDYTSIAKGIYQLQFSTEKGTFTGKIMIE